MTKEEARIKAHAMFGPAGQICEHMQMKESLEPAVGVGFMEDGDLCIQGKGVTWEAAFAHAESRREKWAPRIPVQVEGEPIRYEKYEVTIPGDWVREQMELKQAELDAEKRFQNLVKVKVKEKWGLLKK